MFNIKSIESVGILFAIAAYLSFSLLDVMQKTAVIYHSIFIVVERMSIVAPAVDNGQVRLHRENS